MQIKDITFDDDDKDLFIIDDLQLKADALRYSVLPKLEFLVNHSVARAAERYNLDPLEFSSFVKSPNFRMKRSTEFKIDYEWAQAGISGQRKPELWKGIERHDKKEITVLPFRIEYNLTNKGLLLVLSITSDQFRLKSYKSYLDFHIKYQYQINALCDIAHAHLSRQYIVKDLSFFSSPSDYLKALDKNGLFEVTIFSQILKYPITESNIADMIESFVALYPVYDSYVQIALGKKVRFTTFLGTIDKWLSSETDDVDKDNKKADINTANITRARELADQRVKVLPALRWQVFQRDNWRCVACGRVPDDNIILHIDHIVPRSKGGKDAFENYQTLCNIGNFIVIFVILGFCSALFQKSLV